MFKPEYNLEVSHRKNHSGIHTRIRENHGAK